MWRVISCFYVMIYVGRRRWRSSSFVHHKLSGSNICDSPNFTRTSIPTSLQPHRIWRHQLLPVGSHCEKYRKCRLQRFRVEFLENGLSEDHEILQSCHGLSATNLPDMNSLAASGRLQNAITYCVKRVRSAKEANNLPIV